MVILDYWRVCSRIPITTPNTNRDIRCAGERALFLRSVGVFPKVNQKFWNQVIIALSRWIMN